jgi:hypothetical protein
MSSYSRNIRRANSARRSRVLGAGLALTLLSGAALADGAHRFVFTAYRNAAGGRQVVAGHYRAALQVLRDSADTDALDPAAQETNRCVAYSMTLRLREARVACDAAVRAARKQRDAFPAWWTWIPATYDDDVAIAYANRAVMHWMSNDAAAAHRDLAEARELSPRSGFVAQNLEALEMHAALAQAAAPPPKS